MAEEKGVPKKSGMKAKYKRGDYVELLDLKREFGNGFEVFILPKGKKRKIEEVIGSQNGRWIGRIEKIDERSHYPSIMYFMRLFFLPEDTFFGDGRGHDLSTNTKEKTTCELDMLPRITDRNNDGVLHTKNPYGGHVFHRRMLFVTDFCEEFDEYTVVRLVNVRYFPREIAEGGENCIEFNTYVNHAHSYWFYAHYNHKNHDVRDVSDDQLQSLGFTPIPRVQPQIPEEMEVIDPFMGLGGLDEGLEELFHVEYGIEVDRNTVLNARINHPNTIIAQMDINDWFYIVLCKNGEPDKSKYINWEYLYKDDCEKPYLTKKEITVKRKNKNKGSKKEKHKIDDLLFQRCVLSQTQLLVKRKDRDYYSWKIQRKINVPNLDEFWRENQSQTEYLDVDKCRILGHKLLRKDSTFKLCTLPPKSLKEFGYL
eukprot:TRINITY_DN4080_c0_g1_i2.p1 TRINITY_DN4080_c0_g1~~TRINITY_DN4080_c0_g1_i2.p1  ORF type:complete len:425 (-),score=56.92 TRINITY_DN4080_c0_g1_i2:1158-2432(-)